MSLARGTALARALPLALGLGLALALALAVALALLRALALALPLALRLALPLVFALASASFFCSPEAPTRGPPGRLFGALLAVLGAVLVRSWRLLEPSGGSREIPGGSTTGHSGRYCWRSAPGG